MKVHCGICSRALYDPENEEPLCFECEVTWGLTLDTFMREIRNSKIASALPFPHVVVWRAAKRYIYLQNAEAMRRVGRIS